VYDKDVVRTAYFRHGKSKSQIARELGMDWRTVNKLLEMAPDEVPQYQRKQPVTYPVLGPYVAIINSWLALDAQAPRKQRHTAQRMYERLVEEHGFPGSYSTVRDYLQQVRKKPEDVPLPLAFAPGERRTQDRLFVWPDLELFRRHLF